MKNIIYLLFSVCALVFFTSCEEDLKVYDGPGEVHFSAASAQYFVEAETQPYVVEVSLTNSLSESRTFNINIVDSLSTAVEGVHFTIENKEVSIPAGENFATITLAGDFDALADGNKTLVLGLEETDVSAGFRQQFNLTLIQFCEYMQDNLVGEYTLTSEFWGTSYPVNVVAGDDEFSYVIQGMYDIGLPNVQDVPFTVNQEGPITFTANIDGAGAFDANTPTFSADYGLLSIAGDGDVNTCGEFTFLLEFTVEAGSFGEYTESLIKN